MCLLVRGNPVDRVLLGFKKVGFGSGKYTGFGGKVEPGETVSQAASRELEEETGIHVPPPDLHLVGRLTFLFPHQPSWSQMVHVFLVYDWRGGPVESYEMAPQWFAVDSLPFSQMWQDGAHWLPPILTGQHIEAQFTFDPDNETITNLHILTWDAIPTEGEK